jgi:hypothetical protein
MPINMKFWKVFRKMYLFYSKTNCIVFVFGNSLEKLKSYVFNSYYHLVILLLVFVFLWHPFFTLQSFWQWLNNKMQKKRTACHVKKSVQSSCVSFHVYVIHWKIQCKIQSKGILFKTCTSEIRTLIMFFDALRQRKRKKIIDSWKPPQSFLFPFCEVELPLNTVMFSKIHRFDQILPKSVNIWPKCDKGAENMYAKYPPEFFKMTQKLIELQLAQNITKPKNLCQAWRCAVWQTGLKLFLG